MKDIKDILKTEKVVSVEKYTKLIPDDFETWKKENDRIRKETAFKYIANAEKVWLGMLENTTINWSTFQPKDKVKKDTTGTLKEQVKNLKIKIKGQREHIKRTEQQWEKKYNSFYKSKCLKLEEEIKEMKRKLKEMSK